MSNATQMRLTCLQIAATRFTPSAPIDDLTAEAERFLEWATAGQKQRAARRPNLNLVKRGTRAAAKGGARATKRVANKA